MIENIEWLGHASFRIKEEGKVIYIDPWKIKKPEKADIILITHEHFDHFSKEDVEKLQGENTIIVSIDSVTKKLHGNTRTVKPNEKIKINSIEIECVPAYNTKQERLGYHPKKDGRVGFIINIKGKRIYHVGDSDYIPEMNDIKPDIALIPVSGTYVMDAEEAAEATLKIKPKVAIPMHYGDIVGNINDAKKFKELLKDKVDVKILEIQK
jgi:L-ascorbate metabolism protein UlaG (beta-lactamase superfamily)